MEIQNLDFIIVHASVSQLAVPGTLSRHAVIKLLCQRCYRPLVDKCEVVNAVIEIVKLGSRPSIETMKSKQQEHVGDLNGQMEKI